MLENARKVCGALGDSMEVLWGLGCVMWFAHHTVLCG